MKVLLSSLLLVTACSSPGPGSPLGLGAGTDPADAGAPVCDPPAQDWRERCVALAESSWCAHRQSDEEPSFARRCQGTCPWSARPLHARCGDVVGLVEQRGRDSTAGIRECWYLDGGLVGATAFTDTYIWIAGTRPATSCCTFDAGCATCADDGGC